jgi:hypothetical protein
MRLPPPPEWGCRIRIKAIRIVLFRHAHEFRRALLPEMVLDSGPRDFARLSAHRSLVACEEIQKYLQKLGRVFFHSHSQKENYAGYANGNWLHISKFGQNVVYARNAGRNTESRPSRKIE